MLPLAIDAITFAEIQRVLPDLRESKTLDFKREISIQSKEEKLEFAADVSAFANSSGGDLVYGVAEEGGVAIAMDGTSVADPDQEILRLEQILRASIEPPIAGLRMIWIPKSEQSGLFVVRVPKSWSAPHRVSGNSRFYARNSAGRYPLDVAELRSAFVYGNDLAERIRRFRLERAHAIASNEGALPMSRGAKVILHVVPLSSIATPTELQLTERCYLSPLDARGYNFMPVLEGALSHTGPAYGAGPVDSYALLFRTGVVEATAVTGLEEDARKVISLPAIEDSISTSLQSYIQTLSGFGVGVPVYVFLSLVETSGYYGHNSPRSSLIARPQLRRDHLFLPELVLDDLSTYSREKLRPLADRLANSFGYEKSFTFDMPW